MGVRHPLVLSTLLVWTIFLTGLIENAECFSSGAPAVACVSLSPDPFSHSAGPNTTPVPYSIDLSAFDVGGGVLQYVPETTYLISLSGNSGETYRGFLIQARQRADGSTILGSFSGITTGTTRFSSCNIAEGAVTHNSPAIKTSTNFIWRAPSAGSGSLWFGFAVVQQRTTYWADQRTAVIAEQADCGTLPNPGNGQVTLSGTVLGSSATYSCESGFNIVGSSSRTCQANGQWSGVAPTCQAVDCGTLPNPGNGQVTLSGTVLGSSATYSCDSGFNIVGSGVRICQADGLWSGVAPICQIVDCGILPNPGNGQVTLSGTVLGSSATYSCDSGFNIVGSGSRTCQANGQWSGVAPTCQVVVADCGGLPNPANGQVTLTGTVEGSQASYTCDQGYIPTGGSTVRVCQSDGQWSGTPLVCDFVDCEGLPDPADGQVILTTTTFGSLASYVCDPGFDIVGNTVRQCLESGQWSGSAPTCAAQAIVLELSSSMYTTEEGANFITVTITKSIVTATDIDVVISLSDGTALGGIDYGPFPVAEVNITHTIPGPNTESQFGIQIRDDSTVEQTESFTVELFLPVPSQPQVAIGTVNRATVFINDNDRMMGLGDDPHYSILLPSGEMLCFSVQGEHNFNFNLISNKLLQMNALFVPDAEREEVTWIGALGMVVKHSAYKNSDTTKLRFTLEGKMLYIGDKVQLSVKNVEKISLSEGKLTVSETEDENVQVPEIKVELKDVGLTFFVRYMSNHLDMIWDSVSAQPKDSHGMIGQFFRPGVDIDVIRRMLVLPTMDPVPVMRRPIWAFMEREVVDDKLCWTAMNPGYQGKGLLEGHYLDYLVDDVLSGNFRFTAKQSGQIL